MRSELETKLIAKGLSPSSVKIYVRNVEKLNGDDALKNFNFLKDTNKIMDKLEKYKANTKRTYLISIVSCLGVCCEGSKPLQKLHKQYQDLMMEVDGEIKENPSDEKSETQKENWINWDDVMSRLEELKSKVDFGKKKALNETEYNRLLDYVVLSLYTYQAPRRNADYLNMYIVKSIGDASDGGSNYYVVDSSEFVFNAFKTVKKEGQVVLKVSNELVDVLKLYMKYQPLIKGKIKKGDKIPFLVFYNGDKLHLVNAITRILNKIFGKKVGSSMLRASYLTGKYGDIKEEQREDAKMMSHSVSTQQNIYTKV
jgi:hypothetical protein